jgi:hypothetical protein
MDHAQRHWGRCTEAEAAFQGVLQAERRVLDNNHPDTLRMPTAARAAHRLARIAKWLGSLYTKTANA